MKRSNKKSTGLKSQYFGILLIIIGIFILFFIKPFSNNKKQQQATYQTPQIVHPTSSEILKVNVDTDSSTALSENKLFDAPVSANIQNNVTVLPDKLSEVHGASENHLVFLPKQFTNKPEKVHKETYQALMDMIFAAQSDGITLTVVSAFRSYDRQKQIWERKWGNSHEDDTEKAMEILKWSSFPGTSRHHWGTDIDFNSVNPDYWQTAQGKQIYSWLRDNAHLFGFCQTFGANRNKGYHEEEWHWSHIPVAHRYYHQISQPSVLAIALSQDVKGAKAVRKLTVITDYITGISDCSVRMYAPAIKQKSPIKP